MLQYSTVACIYTSYYPVRGIKSGKFVIFSLEKYTISPKKTTAINNLIRGYYFMRDNLIIISFKSYFFLKFSSQYFLLNS